MTPPQPQAYHEICYCLEHDSLLIGPLHNRLRELVAIAPDIGICLPVRVQAH